MKLIRSQLILTLAAVIIFAFSTQFALAAEQTAPPTPEKADTQPAQTPASEEEQELTVSADDMQMLMDNHTIELEGNVLIEDPTMRLSAKKMLVHLDKDNKIKNIEALGGVTVRKLDSSESATGDSGFYDAVTDVVILRDNCVILQGRNTLTGKQVIYDRKQGTIKLKGASITIPLKKGAGKNSPFDSLMKKNASGDDAKSETPKTDDDKPKQ